MDDNNVHPNLRAGSFNCNGLGSPNKREQICKRRTVVQGRTSLLEIEIENVKYCIVNVYCPNSNETTVVEKETPDSGIPHNKTLTGQKKINKKSQPPPPSSPLLNVDVDEPRHLEDRLSALISDTDQLRTSTNNVAEKLVKLSDVELHIQHQTIQEGQFDDRIKTLSSQLTNLQASFTELKETSESSGQSLSNSPALRPEVQIPNSIEAFVEPSIKSFASKVEVHAETVENFLDDVTCKAISEFLDSEPFIEENGHSVLLFGHPYSYTGSKALSDSPEIPSVIKPLFDELNKLQAKKFNERYPDMKSKGLPPVLNS
ncbi:hypothetical protein ACHWQZ_G012690 [Mnemiopsis leidyi]